MSLPSKVNFKDDYENSNKSSDSCNLTLKCGEVGQALLFQGASIGTSVPAATITLDTSKFCNPCIKLEFTSNLIGTLFQGTLNFQLYKSCNNQLPIPIGRQFSFTQPTQVIFSDVFTFFVCDCNSCSNECCTYSIVVSTGGSASILGNVGIFAARLAAIIVDNPEHDDDCYPCNKLSHKENKTILKCGTPGGAISIVPVTTLPGTNFTLSTLTLNTSCLCDPCVKLEFASTLAYSSPTTIDSTVVSFQVFKLCHNQRNPIPVGPQMVFSVPFIPISPGIPPGFSGTSTFSFFVCDCDICTHECCTYSVVATTATTDATVTITNARLSALATDSNYRCC